MGYSGLDNWNDSDAAAEMHSSICYAAFERMKIHYRRARNQSSGWSTSGAVNVCLVIESKLLNNLQFYRQEKPLDFFKMVEKDMVEKIKLGESVEWDTEANKNFHLKAYRRMLRNLRKFVKSLSQSKTRLV